jgi:tripartite-type tricarboxylate transporter receptor subunit TctC
MRHWITIGAVMAVLGLAQVATGHRHLRPGEGAQPTRPIHRSLDSGRRHRSDRPARGGAPREGAWPAGHRRQSHGWGRDVRPYRWRDGCSGRPYHHDGGYHPDYAALDGVEPPQTDPTYKHFTPVARLNIDPAGVQVAANSEWKTLRDLLEYVKSNPGKVWASGSAKGGSWDLARAGMLKTAGIPVNAMPYVPSTGAAPALQDLVAGRVQVVTASLVEGRPLIDAGKVRALATMAEKRDPVFPNVPTLKELGLDWSMGAWRGIALPKDTSPEIVAVYEKAVRTIVKSKEFVDFMKDGPFGILYKGSTDFSKFLAEQDELMGVLTREAGITK